jgi:hypothetical protein
MFSRLSLSLFFLYPFCIHTHILFSDTTVTHSKTNRNKQNKAITMQYYTLLSILAGAAAVSAGGLTDELLGSSLTGTATGSGSAEAKGALSGLPTDDLLQGGLTGAKAKDPVSDAADASSSDDSSDDASEAAPSKAASKGPLGILDSLGMKQLYKPSGYPYEDPVTTTSAYYDPPTPTFVTRTVTEHHIPTATIRPAPTTTVIGTPANIHNQTSGSAVDSCSEGTATSCCDTKAASDGLLSNILGGSCALSNLNIPVLAVGGLSGSQCNNGNTFCCPVTQNVSYLPLIDVPVQFLTCM